MPSTTSSVTSIRTLSAAFALSLALWGSIPLRIAHADGPFSLAVTPVVFDEKGKARDIINESITLTNSGTEPLELYPTVSDVKDATGAQPFQYAQDSSGLADSLANWIELSRAEIVLAPGETKAVPFSITINENAEPGIYHVAITFGVGNSRDMAEAATPLATVSVNLEVDADIKLAMQLTKFSSDNIVFTGDDVMFKYQLQNIGNQDVQPTGQVAIYDRNGEEVATVDVNKEGQTISPDQTAQLASVWSGANGFGKFKALLTVNYGNQEAAVEDTVFFWVVPWKQLLMLFVACIIAFVVLALYFNRWLETRHLGKLAAEGALVPEVLERLRNSPPPPVIPLPSMPPRPAIPPPAEIVERVQAEVRHKRTIFNLFKRQGFVSMPRSLSQSIEAHTPAHKSATRAGIGGTIDLKQMQKPEAMAETGGHHVINLKKQD